jgi:excinuclease UvrABC nuclease subunit
MELELDAKAPRRPGVYAFVLDGTVVYIGLTRTTLSGRLGGYRRGHPGQPTNARLNPLIVDALKKGKRVSVLIATPSESKWNDLPVNTAAGLEAGLIEMIKPLWNILGAK